MMVRQVEYTRRDAIVVLYHLFSQLLTVTSAPQVLEVFSEQRGGVQQMRYTCPNSCNYCTETGVLCSAMNLTEVPVLPSVGVEQVNHLYLEDNELTEIPIMAFRNLPSLQDLRLSRNQIVVLDAMAFNGVGQLSALWLNDNNITNLATGLFQYTPFLKDLMLYRNHIATLDAQLFAGLVNLGVLDLSFNEIVNFPVDSFQHLPSFAELDLQYNPLNCSLLAHVPDSVTLFLTDSQTQQGSCAAFTKEPPTTTEMSTTTAELTSPTEQPTAQTTPTESSTLEATTKSTGVLGKNVSPSLITCLLVATFLNKHTTI